MDESAWRAMLRYFLLRGAIESGAFSTFRQGLTDQPGTLELPMQTKVSSHSQGVTCLSLHRPGVKGVHQCVLAWLHKKKKIFDCCNLFIPLSFSQLMRKLFPLSLGTAEGSEHTDKLPYSFSPNTKQIQLLPFISTPIPFPIEILQANFWAAWTPSYSS